MIKYISISQALIDNSKNFLTIEKMTLFRSFKYLFSKVTFVGWGRKKSGLWAIFMAKITGNKFLLLEDGFIRSFGLGVTGAESFSLIKDNIGIYYDATTPSLLENILNTYNFNENKRLMDIAKTAKVRLLDYNISKYNMSEITDLSYLDDGIAKVLIVAQTLNDSSLKYGAGDIFSTSQIIKDAFLENPKSDVYIKIHPDVLVGKKKSDISLAEIPKECKILTINANPIRLLKYFDKVYTKTSGMGMEALLLNKEVHCYGIPFYSGWGLTEDKQICPRRKKILTVDELFAGAYILYSSYFLNKEKADILILLEFIKNKL